jgi:hypothetical protein
MVLQIFEHLGVRNVRDDRVQLAGDETLRHIFGFVDVSNFNFWIMDGEYLFCLQNPLDG